MLDVIPILTTLSDFLFLLCGTHIFRLNYDNKKYFKKSGDVKTADIPRRQEGRAHCIEETETALKSRPNHWPAVP